MTTDMGAKKELGGWVYFIQAGNDGPIKIGIAQDTDKRIRNLQVGNPLQLKLLLRVWSETPHHLESSLHKCFANLSTRGEWFKPKSYILDSISYIEFHGASAFFDKVEDEWINAWSEIESAYTCFCSAMRIYRDKGDINTMNYIMAEAKELVDDLTYGRY